MNFWSADSDMDYAEWIHELDEPRTRESEDEPRLGDPIVPSFCPVCREPVMREKALCARCKVAA